MHERKQQDVDRKSTSTEAYLQTTYQTCPVRETRRARGGAAVRPSSGAAAVSGGVKKGKLATRDVVRDAEARDAEHDAGRLPKRKLRFSEKR